MIRKARQGDAVGIATVHVDSWRSTYKGIVPDSYLESLSYEERAEMWKRAIGGNPLYVAEDENGKIVGFATGGKERSGKYADYTGELYAIYLLEEAQGNKMGSQLVEAISKELDQMGITSMLVWVLEQNPSKHFYERLGGDVIDSTTITIGGEEFLEIAYGWKDHRILMQKG
ncbi:GNAT family N-acetyltransferase [Sporosarcina cyprini]|uniref:GNAT family N-acetyltransferase n=1 Tax=Sporosarcina cyprini TaxID=2910523 RepID=UPI001EE0B5A5|nr:GNAT family N-acetyltransferase [Sporosarcina cyprini]MCG3087520.1 GNAT family N-acetyltransferase [Sporosarcina cyprini]